MKLPVTVTSITKLTGQTYEVAVAYFDGTVGYFLVPETLATTQGVRLSALVMAQLVDIAPPLYWHHHPSRRRHEPRAG